MKNLLKRLNLLPDKEDVKALIISFALINFAFLYQTMSYTYGNHDILFVRNRLFFNSGFFEARFTQFITQSLLLMGQILPIVNNILAFALFTLGLWILAKYWHIKKTVFNYVLFIVFLGTEPYTLSWLYFQFITISCLQWVLFAVLGLYLSAQIYESKHKILMCLASIICFYVPIAGYPPVINLLAVGVCGNIAITYITGRRGLKDLFNIHKYTLINIIIAAIAFKLTMYYIANAGTYNVKMISLADIRLKFFSAKYVAENQFSVTVPFMEAKYKYVLYIMSLTAGCCGLLSARPLYRLILGSCFILSVVYATSLVTFLAASPTQYVPRIDFYGTGFMYGFFLALMLAVKPKTAESLALLFSLILIPANIINDSYALRVWKQGFDAEMEIRDRMVERIENTPEFDKTKEYRYYAAGDITLRSRYYRGQFEVNDPFTLSYPYLAMWQAGTLIEFYPSTIKRNPHFTIMPDDITPELYNFYMNEAHPWPHKTSVLIKDDFIIVVYNNYGLNDFKHNLEIMNR